MRERGFCYVANTAGYRDEAIRSATSLRTAMGDVPVAMVTRRELYLDDSPVSDWIELPEGREGPIIKTSAWLAPFNRIVLLDTDTYVAGDLSGLFEILDGFDLAAAVDVTRGYDYGFDIPHAFPEINTGVIAFRKSAVTRGLFQGWDEENDRLCRKLGVRILNDQASFRAALWRSADVRYCAITAEYNFLGSAPGVAAATVRIVHERSDRPSLLAEELNRFEGPRAFVPGLGTIRPFRGRLHLARDLVQLALRALKILFRPSHLIGPPAPVDWAMESEAEAARKRRGILS